MHSSARKWGDDPETRNPKPETETRNPKTETRNRNLKPETRNLKPETRKQVARPPRERIRLALRLARHGGERPTYSQGDILGVNARTGGAALSPCELFMFTYL